MGGKGWEGVEGGTRGAEDKEVGRQADRRGKRSGGQGENGRE